MSTTERVALTDVLCRDGASARAALELAGCVVEPDLAMTVEHPMLGTIHRMFGVVRNLVAEPDAPDVIDGASTRAQLPPEVEEQGRRFGQRLVKMLDAPDNDLVADKLRDSRLSYMPANKRIAQTMRKMLGDGGAHLPWALQPLNLDLSMKVQRHCKDYGFVVFYSVSVKMPVGSPPSVELGRIFSTPFGVTGFGTWQEPISQEILDEDVGLVLEANYASIG
ncbi:MAG: hypothetical protein H6737_26735 [Alphaproteobacteria bacterium]|nr:hypothetical protein [Alphaproteobacteria bacterium]